MYALTSLILIPSCLLAYVHSSQICTRQAVAAACRFSTEFSKSVNYDEQKKRGIALAVFKSFEQNQKHLVLNAQ
jgi:hypothetical protein